MKLAIDNSRRLEKNYTKTKKTISNGMASDAFFPFPDSIKMASRKGISCIIQPGGSINDLDVIKAADKIKYLDDFYKKEAFQSLNIGLDSDAKSIGTPSRTGNFILATLDIR